MLHLDAQSGSNPSVPEAIGRNRGRIAMAAAIVGIAALGWFVLWSMVSDHASQEGGFAVLGPGMALFDDVARLLGSGGLAGAGEGLWGDICRAFAAGGATASGAWPAVQFAVALAMWMIMALAMMLPTAMPVISAFGDIQFAARDKGMEPVPGSVFVAGYLAVWGAMALLGASLQWTVSLFMGAEPVLVSTAPVIGGVLLVFAGLYQWSALKAACLSQCRSPMRFFMTHWHDGRFGAFRMGLRHGLFCVGCCWALMALMFVGGTMNLVWMAVLTVVMLLEKVLPERNRVARVFSHGAGVVFIAWGGLLLVSGLLEMGLFQ